jgi:hypothetical protein
LGHSKNPTDHILKARYMELGQIRQTTTGQSDRKWEDYAVFWQLYEETISDPKVYYVSIHTNDSSKQNPDRTTGALDKFEKCSSAKNETMQNECNGSE